mmetsp:Transcript_1060/g.1446  ORF Transcript_1060/g.1446 Transcript_1060/m.1446 type:complete len:134 (-) Transcript_1060:12-413(-)
MKELRCLEKEMQAFFHYLLWEPTMSVLSRSILTRLYLLFLLINVQSLKTNMITRDFRCPNLQYFSWNGVGTHAYQCIYSHPIQVSKGEEIGHFNFGSTVVLIFESEDFEFSVQPGDRVLMGQLLGKDKPMQQK